MKSTMIVLILIFFAQVIPPRAPTPAAMQAKQTEAAERDPVYPFNGSLVFEDGVVRGFIRKSEIDSLLARRVKLGRASAGAGDELDFFFEEGYFPVLSCLEWVPARAQGLSSDLNTRDRAVESFFVHTCGFLSALREAKPAKQSFIAKPRVGLSNLNLLPPNILESLAGDGESEIEKFTAAGVRISDLVARRKVKVLAKTLNSVVLKYDMEMHLTEMGRADFDGDGIEDIFVASAMNANPGSFRYYDYFILTRPSPSAPLEVKQPDWPRLSKHSTALSAGIDLRSSQLTKATISQQDFGEAWPFDTDKGELACAKVGAIAVFFIANGKTYALNSWASHCKIDGETVILDTYREIANIGQMGAIFSKAFAICQTKAAR